DTWLGCVLYDDEYDFYLDEDDFTVHLWDDVNGYNIILSEYGNYGGSPRELLYANSLNNDLQVSGWHIAYGIFIYERPFSDLDIKPLMSSTYIAGNPTSINNNGQIVGSTSTDLGISTGLQALGYKDATSQFMSSMYKLLRLTNNVGKYDYGHVIEMLQTSTLPGFSNLKKVELNNYLQNHPWYQQVLNQIITEQISFSHQSSAFIWDEVTGIKSIGTLGGTWSTAWDINDHGQVVGYSSTAEGYRAFYWDEIKGMIELPSLGGNSQAKAINNKGQIVGYSYDASGNFFPVQWNVTRK
ncbi:MAG: DUF3466 family protein, partial [Balneolaceae bacterium]